MTCVANALQVIVEAGHLGTSMYFMDGEQCTHTHTHTHTCTNMYIHTHTHIAGCCRYIGEDRTVIELGDGDFFGESAFIITLRIMSTAGV